MFQQNLAPKRTKTQISKAGMVVNKQ